MVLNATFPPFIQALSCHRGGRGVGVSKKRKLNLATSKKMAHPTRFELVTSAFGGKSTT